MFALSQRPPDHNYRAYCIDGCQAGRVSSLPEPVPISDLIRIFGAGLPAVNWSCMYFNKFYELRLCLCVLFFLIYFFFSLQMPGLVSCPGGLIVIGILTLSCIHINSEILSNEGKKCWMLQINTLLLKEKCCL